MKIKKLMALFLAAATLSGCLTGCGQEAANGTESTKQSSETEATATSVVEEKSLYNTDGSLPIVNEPITLKVLMKDETNKAYAKVGDSDYWDWLTEKTGITFEVESYSKDEMASKLPLIMATPDEMPDLFFNVGFTSADVLSYGQNGQLLMLDDLLDEYGTNIKAAFDEVDGLYGGTIASDGHIYSIPRVAVSASDVVYVLNSRFMENAGVTEVPETIEELYEVFQAIKKVDANGDGTVGNEICWGGEPKAFKRYALSMVGIPCYWPWEGCIFDDVDGEVYFVPTSEEYKYLLSWLQTFYVEGMIDPEIFTQTSEQRTAKIKSDLVFMNHTYDDPEKATYEGRSGAFFPTIPITSAVSKDEPIVCNGSMYQPDMGAVSAYTEYPEICMLLLDYLYDDEASKVARYGLEGVDYEIVKETGNIVSADPDNFSTGNGPTCLTTPSMGRQWFTAEETKLAKDRREWSANYGVMGWQNYLKFTDTESESINTLSADLGLYCDDFFVGVITGNYDLEKDWDAYVKACKDMQVEELTKVYQSAYNRFYGVE